MMYLDQSEIFEFFFKLAAVTIKITISLKKKITVYFFFNVLYLHLFPIELHYHLHLYYILKIAFKRDLKLEEISYKLAYNKFLSLELS